MSRQYLIDSLEAAGNTIEELKRQLAEAKSKRTAAHERDRKRVDELVAMNADLKRELTEVHVFLTGKFETGWCMTHPDGEPETELGKAAKTIADELIAAREREKRLVDELNCPDYLASRFHYWYEKLSSTFNYETREESAVEWEDVPQNNRRLMSATVQAVVKELLQRVLNESEAANGD